MHPHRILSLRCLSWLALGGLALGLTACGNGGGGGSRASAPPAEPTPLAPTYAVEIESPSEHWTGSRGSPIPMTYRAEVPEGARLRVLTDKDGDPATTNDQALLMDHVPATGRDVQTLAMPSEGFDTSGFFLLLESYDVGPALQSVSEGRVGFDNLGFVRTLGVTTDLELEPQLQYRTLVSSRQRLIAAETTTQIAYLDADAPIPVELISPRGYAGTYVASHTAEGAYEWHTWFTGGYIMMGLCEQPDGALVCALFGNGPLDLYDAEGKESAFASDRAAPATVALVVIEPTGAIRDVHRIELGQPIWHDSTFEVVSRGPEGGFILAGAARTSLTVAPRTPQAQTLLGDDVELTPYAIAFDANGQVVAAHAGTPDDWVRVDSVAADPRGGAVLGLIARGVCEYPAADGTTHTIGDHVNAFEVGYVRLDTMGFATGSWTRRVTGDTGGRGPTVAVGSEGDITVMCFLRHDEDLLFGGDPATQRLVLAGETGRCLIRVDAADREVWAHPLLHRIPRMEATGRQALAARADGSVVVSMGQRDSLTLLDGTAIPNRVGDTQVLTFALSPDGARLWHRLDGGGAMDDALSIDVLQDDSVLVGAEFAESNSIWGRGELNGRALGDGPRRLLIRLNANGSL